MGDNYQEVWSRFDLVKSIEESYVRDIASMLGGCIALRFGSLRATTTEGTDLMGDSYVLAENAEGRLLMTLTLEWEKREQD